MGEREVLAWVDQADSEDALEGVGRRVKARLAALKKKAKESAKAGRLKATEGYEAVGDDVEANPGRDGP